MEQRTLYKKKTRQLDIIAYGIIYFCAFLSIIILVGIVGYISYRGIPYINLQFLTTESSALKGTTGIAGNIVNTLYIIILTLLIAIPLGVGSAIYLNEYAMPGRLVRLIKFTTETLSGIPSVVFGLFGYVFFGTTLKLGYSLLTGSLTLTLIILPLITRNTQEALKAVPDSYRIGALGIGATKWYMIRTILLPSAMPGIIAGIILSVGRIVGESAALMFTAGSGHLLPKLGQYFEGLLKKILQPGGTLTIELFLSMEKAKYDTAFGIAFVLLVMVLGINVSTKYLLNKMNVDKKRK